MAVHRGGRRRRKRSSNSGADFNSYGGTDSNVNIKQYVNSDCYSNAKTNTNPNPGANNVYIYCFRADKRID